MGTKYPIRHYIPLFSAKFDSDFATFQLSAILRINNTRKEIPTDVPMRYILAQYHRVFTGEAIVCEINISYEGGWDLSEWLKIFIDWCIWCMQEGDGDMVGVAMVANYIKIYKDFKYKKEEINQRKQ